jgi:hypothetical protein
MDSLQPLRESLDFGVLRCLLDWVLVLGIFLPEMRELGERSQLFREACPYRALSIA